MSQSTEKTTIFRKVTSKRNPDRWVIYKQTIKNNHVVYSRCVLCSIPNKNKTTIMVNPKNIIQFNRLVRDYCNNYKFEIITEETLNEIKLNLL